MSSCGHITPSEAVGEALRLGTGALCVAALLLEALVDAEAATLALREARGLALSEGGGEAEAQPVREAETRLEGEGVPDSEGAEAEADMVVVAEVENPEAEAVIEDEGAEAEAVTEKEGAEAEAEAEVEAEGVAVQLCVMLGLAEGAADAAGIATPWKL